MRTEKANSGQAAEASSKVQDMMAGVGQPNGAGQAGVIDQVRELLFGETKRTTEQGIKALEDKLDALAATMHARFSEMETRASEAQRDAENSQASAIDDIGSAIAQLGASIRNMSGVRKSR
jgi:hypothetical protein